MSDTATAIGGWSDILARAAAYDAAQRARLTDRRNARETYWHAVERRTSDRRAQ